MMTDHEAGIGESEERIPGEFLYWENLNKPGARRLRRVLKTLFQTDPALPDDVVRKWAQSYYDADPVAEAFVDDVYILQGQAEGRKLLDRALEHGVESIPDAPESLRRLFAEMEVDPQWLDWELVDLGARAFRRFGTHMYSFAGAVTLEAYQENSVAKPLAFTGAYAGESASRRFLETAAFWIDVSEPGAMRRGGQGVKTALRVRLMHVFVRRRLLRHPNWDLAAWGVPISQGDALLTLMGGSFVPGLALKALGYRTSKREILAMMHFWRYVGHLMGVQPRWYPTTLKEALGLMFAAQVKGAKLAGEDGKNLAMSYVKSYAPGPDDDPLGSLRKLWTYYVELGYVRLFLPGTTFTRAFDLPRPGIWRLHPAVQFPFVFGLETARMRLPGVDDWVDARARKRTKKWLQDRLGPRKAEYAAVENFTR